ncbi:MAG: hypothetical protein KF768_02220 [Phycisphaeraceae bacterium]|nr:hypothetical protein [Phycisphaeraceae bacterium]
MDRPHPLLKTRRPVVLEHPSRGEKREAGVRVVRLKPTPAQPAERIEIPESAGAIPERSELANLVEEAGARLLVLRRTLDEAVSVTAAAKREVGGLAGALGTLDRASEAIGVLEDVLGRIGSLRDALAADFDRRLDRHKRKFEEVISELNARTEARVARVEEALSRRVDAVEAQGILEIEQAAERLREKSTTAAARAAEAEANSAAAWQRAGAEIDRRSAQAQARTAVLLDSAREELAEMERRAQRIAEAGAHGLRELGERAASLVGAEEGIDWRKSARPGSLAEVVRHAEEVLTTLQSVSGRAREASLAAEEAEARLTEVVDRSEGRSALLERCMADATKHAEDMALSARRLSELLARVDGRIGAIVPGESAGERARGKRSARAA